jgi:anaerobic magnesium-protoporphyrin IX monomethyl ester cyclase
VTLIAGRGCIYNCSYCQPAERLIFGKGLRRRSPENVIAELEILRDTYAFNSMMIHDDCLTEDAQWVMRFCRLYKEKGFTQPFVCQSRPDIICNNEAMVKELQGAGLSLCIIGFESGSDRILKFLRKGTTVSQNLKAAKICRAYGIKIWANYMLGLPTETKQEQIATYRMLKKISPYHCSPAYYTPHPGSDLFTYGLNHNLHLNQDHYSYRRNKYEPKIKGVDYVFLEKILRKSFALGETQRNVTSRLKSHIPLRIRAKIKGLVKVLKGV